MAAWEQAPIADPAQKRPAWEDAPMAQPGPPAAVQAGRALLDILLDIPRQVGLTARYAIEGPAQAAQIVTEPIRQAIVNPIARFFGGEGVKPLAEGASQLADMIGLPSPQDANERVVGDAARLVAGGAMMSGVARAAANATTGLASKVAQFLAANPGSQMISGAGAGGASGAVREAGGGPAEQAIAGVIGGLAAPAAAGAVSGAASKVGDAFRKITATPQQVDQQISLVLQRQGVDWSQIPEAVRQGIRAEAAQALNLGELDGAALARLVDFRRVGATPTRGTLTLDPVQITREKNLAKVGANSGDMTLHGLARLENQNNATLIDAMNRSGAANAPDAVTAGQRVIDALQGGLRAEKGNVDALYAAARDSAGRSFPLDGGAFTSAANKALDDALLGGALPPSVSAHLNRIAKGEVPFTVDYAEQLKTAIGNLQRSSSDGQQRMALGLVRRALDETPVMGLGQQAPAAGARALNPGNLPAVPNAPQLGEDAVAAFGKARAANRAMMGRIESTPALQAVHDGVAPDQFVQKFIIGSGATIRDVQALRAELAQDPAAAQAVRSHLADWLKAKALNGMADETGNFSQSAYNKALAAIGDQKLRAFFAPEELDQLHAIGRVASYTQFQPRGSAVNNSNSGALTLGRGLDFLDAIAGRLPVVNNTIQGFIRGAQQKAAANVVPALVAPQALTPAQSVPRLPAAVTMGGLVALPAPPDRKDR